MSVAIKAASSIVGNDIVATSDVAELKLELQPPPTHVVVGVEKVPQPVSSAPPHGTGIVGAGVGVLIDEMVVGVVTVGVVRDEIGVGVVVIVGVVIGLGLVAEQRAAPAASRKQIFSDGQQNVSPGQK